MQEGIEQFVVWTKRKVRHHVSDLSPTFHYKEREIWWAALGQNIGFEINGKHEFFERPVVILKRYNENMCFVVPLSTQVKNPLPFYQILVNFDVKPSVAIISHGKTISTKRLLRKAAKIDIDTYRKILFAFKNQFKQ